MLGIYICDDIDKHRRILEKYINDTILIEEYDMGIVMSTSDPYMLIDHVASQERRSIYFLDIDLHANITGFQLAEKIRMYDPRGYIIFVTTHGEMAKMTFKYRVEAMDFIEKENLLVMQESISRCLQQVLEREIASNIKEKHCFIFKQKGYVLKEDLDDIISFEICDGAHKVLMCSIQRQAKFYSSLKEVEQMLDQRFVRCSDAVIVNTDKISQIDKKKRIVTMTNGMEYLASVRKVKFLLENREDL